MRRGLQPYESQPIELRWYFSDEGQHIVFAGGIKRLITNRQSKTARKCSPMGTFSGPRSPDDLDKHRFSLLGPSRVHIILDSQPSSFVFYSVVVVRE